MDNGKFSSICFRIALILCLATLVLHSYWNSHNTYELKKEIGFLKQELRWHRHPDPSEIKIIRYDINGILIKDEEK